MESARGKEAGKEEKRVFVRVFAEESGAWCGVLERAGRVRV